MNEILRVENVGYSYGNLSVLSEVYLEVSSESIHGIVGANGAGKSTLLSIISGYLRGASGRLTFLGIDITDATIKDRIKFGIARTFQKVELYQALDVYDHILLAIRQKFKLKSNKTSFWDFLKPHGATLSESQLVDELLETVGLTSLGRAPVSTLSLGLSRMVELARALALDPKLVLLDEPSSGLNPDETDQFTNLIMKLSRSTNTSFLIVEHDLTVVKAITDTLTVLDMGRLLATGNTADVLDNSIVKHTYLGR